MLEDGRLHLSGIEVLAPHLDTLNRAEKDELLVRATHKTQREIKELVAELAPKPDVPPSIRKVPERGKNKTHQPPPEQDRADAASDTRTSTDQSTLDGQSSTPDPLTEPAANQRDEREQVEPLSPARYKVQFTASAELREKLERLTALMPGKELMDYYRRSADRLREPSPSFELCPDRAQHPPPRRAAG